MNLVQPRITFWLVLVGLLLASSGMSAQTLNWQTLQYPDADAAWCFGMSPSGDMVGVYWQSGVQHGFLLSHGTYTGPLPGRAHGINARGDIVGDYLGGSQPVEGFIYRNGTYSTFVYPGGVPMTHTWDINARGDIVGFYMNGPTTQGFLRSNAGEFTEIKYPGSLKTWAYGISPQGEIVGEYQDSEGFFGFLRARDGSFTKLQVSDSQETAAYKINARGEIVGYYWDSANPPKSHGFLWRAGVFTTVDYPDATHTMIHGFNSEGEMCGMASFSPAEQLNPDWGGFLSVW